MQPIVAAVQAQVGEEKPLRGQQQWSNTYESAAPETIEAPLIAVVRSNTGTPRRTNNQDAARATRQRRHHSAGPRKLRKEQQRLELFEYYPKIGLFTTSDRNEKGYITARLRVGQRDYRAIIDVGADVSICTPVMAKNPAFRAFAWPTPELLLPDGNRMPISGAVQGIVRDGQAEITTAFVVSPPALPEAAVLGGVTLIAIHDMLGATHLQYHQGKGFSIRYDFEAKGKITESLGKQKEAAKDLDSQRFEAPEYVALDIVTYPTRTYVAGRIRGTKAVGRWDTGAPRSLCRATTAFKHGLEKISSEAPAIHFLNGRPVPTIGIARMHFETAHLTSTIEALIVPRCRLQRIRRCPTRTRLDSGSGRTMPVHIQRKQKRSLHRRSRHRSQEGRSSKNL